MIGFFDLETGGFSITKNGICEIAAIAVDESDLSIKDQFHELIKPYTRADDTDDLVSYKEDSMIINGLTERQLIELGKDVVIVCRSLHDFIIKNNITTLIGHCSKTFDIHRVKYLFERFLGIDLMVLVNQDDTHEIAKSKLNLPNYKLATVCDFFGIVNNKAHSALGDTYATYELYKKLIA